MNFKSMKNKKFYMLLCVECFILIFIVCYIIVNTQSINHDIIMGGKLHLQDTLIDTCKMESETINLEKFFRPSKLPILNTTDINFNFLDKYYNKSPSEIVLDSDLISTPEKSIINYFSLLREASYYDETSKKHAGCGSIGIGSAPYPIAYNFLSQSYQKKLSYKEFLNSFDNIFHINLIKIIEIPQPKEKADNKIFFVEIETIEGSDKPMTNFGYYYGFVDLIKENDLYKINDMNFYGEDFICAPYHGWKYYGELYVETKYGNWCNLIDGEIKSETDNNIKKIYFNGTDKNEYMIQFVILTNDTDVEVAQYKKNSLGEYEPIKLNPEKCLDKN